MKKRRIQRPPRVWADAGQLWAEIEDYFVPNVRVWLGERVVYFHLIRKTRLAGKRTLRTSIGELSNALCLSKTAARTAVRRLAGKGVLRILDRSHDGHKLEVRTPREIEGCVKKERKGEWWEALLENCSGSRESRRAIFEREGHRCFYCLRQLETRGRALDHVVPRVRGGRDSYRNVVACCAACNSAKKVSAAEDFVRRLHRQDLLSRREFYRRQAVLRDFKQGRLRPSTEKREPSPD